MSAAFSLARFGHLFRSHWSESRRGYAWFACVAAMVDLIVIALIFAVGDGDRATYSPFTFDGQASWFFTGIFITGIIFAARYANGLSNPAVALVTLMRPASHFEKWLMAVLWIGILFPLAYTALYSAVHWPSVQIARLAYESLPPDLKNLEPAPDFSFYFPLFTEALQKPGYQGNSPMEQALLFMFLNTLQAFCLGCSYFFKRAAALKTAILGFVLFLCIMGMTSVMDIGVATVIAYWTDTHPVGWESQPLDQAFAALLVVGVPALLWVAAYFHLRERDLS